MTAGQLHLSVLSFQFMHPIRPSRSSFNWVSFRTFASLHCRPQDDVRVLGNLFDGVNDTFDARHMWLTPFAPFQPATLWLFFDRPITLSCVRVWNYSRTPSRGVHNMMVSSLRLYCLHGHSCICECAF